uniref:non-specific serine/threonine protein kinase n=1 Tax=Wollemia nobilis TaxID=56998 RepID=A0A0C9RNS3_9CONI
MFSGVYIHFQGDSAGAAGAEPKALKMELRMIFALTVVLAAAISEVVEVEGKDSCRGECEALGSLYLYRGLNSTYILQTLFNNVATDSTVLSFNKNIADINSIIAGKRLNIPFACQCLSLPTGGSTYRGHNFNYTVQTGDTYDKIAGTYSNLTSGDWMKTTNTYPETGIPDGVTLNVSVNCSCGDPDISKEYGFFLTYPLLNITTSDSLAKLSQTYGISENVLKSYNKDVDFNQTNELVFIPVKDTNESYRPLQSGNGISVGAIAGISVGSVAVVSITIGLLYFYVYKPKAKKSSLLHSTDSDELANRKGTVSPYARNMELVGLTGSGMQGVTDITVDKSVEFSYQELAECTDDFSIVNKIGQGGFGAVYYGELRGEKAAIKKMDMQATKEFLAELKVLTHVHHLNLVRLIGYCTEESLFLVYEFIENGNLSQHLRGSAMGPLSWSARVQIALDSARGLEYIHEHTVPVYIHRDIKSANILIDKNFHGKVADFGLTKLTEVGGASSTLPTRLVGTFGYMPPEYAQFGDVSPKVDVYAFGVVLYEMISAKEAIVKIDDVSAESKGLVTLFESILKDPNGRERLPSIIDPRLGNNYPLESVWKMAQLARACTQENPQLRPSMRTVVVALMTLSSSTEDWDVGSVYENQALVNLMAGR